MEVAAQVQVDAPGVVELPGDGDHHAAVGKAQRGVAALPRGRGEHAGAQRVGEREGPLDLRAGAHGAAVGAALAFEVQAQLDGADTAGRTEVHEALASPGLDLALARIEDGGVVHRMVSAGGVGLRGGQAAEGGQPGAAWRGAAGGKGASGGTGGRGRPHDTPQAFAGHGSFSFGCGAPRRKETPVTTCLITQQSAGGAPPQRGRLRGEWGIDRAVKAAHSGASKGPGP
ncbi:hypothetical protein D3C72_1511900 [compost metagenome]